MPHPLRPNRGLTLIEMLATLAVLLVVLGSALPSFRGAFERRELEAATAQLTVDIRLARSLAASLSQDVRVSFLHDEARGSCYVIHTGGAGHCSCSPLPGEAATQCRDGAVAHRVAQFGAESRLRLQANVRSMLIDDDLGTVTPTGTLRWQTATSGGLNQVVNLHGRVRICSPQGQVPGYRVC
jgi:type IV fimbrial biogenesis protein FimT